ncbi:MAG: PspC domain-containing protein, partial [Paludibacteraceae bacterium]|nr:PspC domain-containing protein [Paludibacteraceae bacterium]
AAGLAAYLGLEITITRLILLLLAITVLGWLIPIYLLVWLIAPEATTTAQKLEMQGIEPSIENIKSYLNSEQLRESASRIGSRLGEIVKWLFRIVAIIVGIFFAFIGVIIIGALTIALIGIITAGTSAMMFGDILPIGNSNATIIMFIISTLIAILIPIISIILATIRLIRRDNTPRKSGWGWMWFIIWIIATIVSISTLVMSASNVAGALENFEKNGFITIFDENTTTEERLRNTQFTEIEIDDALVVQLIEDTCSFIEVKGSTAALRNIKTYVEGNTLNLEL